MLSFYLCTLVALFDIVLSYAHYSDSGFTGHLLQKRKKSGDDNSATPVLIGDLRYRIQSQEAQDIANILLDDRGGVKSETNEYDTKPVDDVLECSAADPCCQYYFISEELTDAFLEADKQCNDMARAAIRLGFHDAGTWSQSLADAGQDFGGADGSLALFFEDDKPENGGLFEVTELARDIYYRYDVGMADLIQYMATHATVSCPLGPRIRTYVGREDAVQPAPDGLLPSVHAPADDLIALFEDKTITPHMLTALLGAHSTSKQFGVDHAKHGAPQDSTPGVWDVEYYNQTLDSYESECVFKFESDVKLAKHPRMKDEWQGFIDDQDHWNEDFAAAYLRLSLLGVNNINELKECSKTLPPKKNRSPKNIDVCTAASSSNSLISSTTSTPTSSSTSGMFTTTTAYNSTSSAIPNTTMVYNTSTPAYPTTTLLYNATSVSSYLYATTTPEYNTTLVSTWTYITPTSTYEYNTTGSYVSYNTSSSYSTYNTTSSWSTTAAYNSTSSSGSWITTMTSGSSVSSTNTVVYGSAISSSSATVMTTSELSSSDTDVPDYGSRMSSTSSTSSSSTSTTSPSSYSVASFSTSTTSTLSNHQYGSTSTSSITGTSSFSIPTSETRTATSTTSSYSYAPYGSESISLSSSSSVHYYGYSSKDSYASASPEFTSTSAHNSYPTVISTSYVDICSTGLKTVPYTYSTILHPASSAYEYETPDDWTTAVTVCTHCYDKPTTITLTKPVEATHEPTLHYGEESAHPSSSSYPVANSPEEYPDDHHGGEEHHPNGGAYSSAQPENYPSPGALTYATEGPPSYPTTPAPERSGPEPSVYSEHQHVEYPASSYPEPSSSAPSLPPHNPGYQPAASLKAPYVESPASPYPEPSSATPSPPSFTKVYATTEISPASSGYPEASRPYATSMYGTGSTMTYPTGSLPGYVAPTDVPEEFAGSASGVEVSTWGGIAAAIIAVIALGL